NANTSSANDELTSSTPVRSRTTSSSRHCSISRSTTGLKRSPSDRVPTRIGRPCWVSNSARGIRNNFTNYSVYHGTLFVKSAWGSGFLAEFLEMSGKESADKYLYSKQLRCIQTGGRGFLADF